ncbi:MAG: bifunctional 3-(3-hydroxy-phenyl)propionate/3-hydroxycinnamic acid hydroxylase [Xanthobacteraceae bacterium]
MTYDAIIVGYGPVGATAAALLARYGLRVAVVEQSAAIYDRPRAIALDHEVMRIFQACGAAAAIAPFTAPHPGTHYLGVDGKVIRIFDPLPPPHPLGWPPSGTFVQPQVEAVLRAHVAAAEKVDVFLEHEATGFTQADDGVDLTVRDAGRPVSRVLNARYLLGCDGANSFVRKQLGLSLEDLAFDEPWMVVDVKLQRPVDLPQKCVQYCWPSRPATFIVGPGNLRRWEIKLLPGEAPEDFGRRENVVEQLRRFVDPAAIEIWRSAVYRFHAVVAERWLEGRVFLLGDAAHQTPPFLGQGMCAGIRDASNLAWKLAMVLRSGARPSLLASYELERKPHVRALVALAKDFGKIIGELDLDAARSRDATLRGQLERGEAETIRQRYIPNLSAGVIDTGAQASRAAGTLFVQPRIREGDRSVLLDDLLEPRFLLATSSNEAQDWLTPSAHDLWQRIGGERIVVGKADRRPLAVADTPAVAVRHLAETDGLFTDWMARQAGAAALVRPDRTVFGVADNAAELNRLVAALGQQIFGE